RYIAQGGPRFLTCWNGEETRPLVDPGPLDAAAVRGTGGGVLPDRLVTGLLPADLSRAVQQPVALADRVSPVGGLAKALPDGQARRQLLLGGVPVECLWGPRPRALVHCPGPPGGHPGRQL